MRIGYHKVWIPVFEGEGDGDAGAATGTKPPEADVGNQGGDPPPNDNGASGEKTFSQEEVNKILAAEKRKHQKVAQKAIEEAAAATKKASLTAQERQEADERLEQLRTELLTKEQQAKRAAERLKNQHKEERNRLTKDRDYWKKEYTDSTIQRAITDAAASNNAFSPTQVVAILGPNTKLAEVLDEEGKPTGRLEPKIRFRDTDKEGKPVTLELSPKDAVKRMKEMDEFLNLFRGEGSGGVGSRSQPGGKKPDLRTLARDPKAFREARKAGKLDF